MVAKDYIVWKAVYNFGCFCKVICINVITVKFISINMLALSLIHLDLVFSDVFSLFSLVFSLLSLLINYKCRDYVSSRINKFRDRLPSLG